MNHRLLEDIPARPLPAEFAPLANKRILVTGAAGFIGGALLRRLREYGLNARGTVLHDEEARAMRAKGYDVEVLDLAASEPWDALIGDVDVLFNIAALFQEAEHSEAMYRKVNVDGTLRLAQTAASCGVGRFVHCSTVGVHGDVKEVPCTERSPFNPMDEYHRTKLEGELAVLDFGGTLPAEGMVLTVNRPAMVYGPGDLRMLKLFKAIKRGKFIMIGSGKVLAHLGHIRDQVDSLLLSAVRPRKDVHLEAFNIASDRYITLDELVQSIADASGATLPRYKVPVRPVWAAAYLCEAICRPFGIKPPIFRRRVGFFTHNRAFDLTKARERLGYVSKVSHREGIGLTIDWYRQHGLI